jgi:VanZ family protein
MMEAVARRRALAWCAAVLYAGAIFIVSSRPGDELPSAFPHADKLVHAAVYGVLGALLAVAAGGGARRPGASVAALLLAAAYGASDEWHQGFVPGRDPSFFDLVADILGAAGGIFLVARRSERARRAS